ncbi:MAG: chromate transporter [Cyanobacteria bacterium SIG32]|nr:chromate transporter [Cyanobacteria bacterium SIG32]
MNKSFYTIFKTFFKVGTMLLGGGYVILPLLQSELVEKKEWINSDELVEYYALSQSVPGIIAANISVFTGYKLKGFIGAIAAILGVITPAFLAIILLASLLQTLVSMNIVQNIFWGVGIGVIMLLYLATKEMWNKSITDKFTCVVFITTFIMSACFKTSPALIIICAIIAGILYRSNLFEHLKKMIGGENDLS